jgi:hypothetical protein
MNFLWAHASRRFVARAPAGRGALPRRRGAGAIRTDAAGTDATPTDVPLGASPATAGGASAWLQPIDCGSRDVDVLVQQAVG